MKAKLLIATLALAFTTTAHADILGAITGHATDFKNRFTHDDEVVQGIVIAKGEFREDDPGTDALHWADGHVSLIRTDGKFYLQFGMKFDTGFAPDLYVYTSDTFVEDEETFENARNLREVSMLKSGSGAQYYEVDELHGDNVTIWCKQFSQFMGSATMLRNVKDD